VIVVVVLVQIPFFTGRKCFNVLAVGHIFKVLQSCRSPAICGVNSAEIPDETAFVRASPTEASFRALQNKCVCIFKQN
jgi:hypothetical protein